MALARVALSRSDTTMAPSTATGAPPNWKLPLPLPACSSGVWSTAATVTERVTLLLSPAPSLTWKLMPRVAVCGVTALST